MQWKFILIMARRYLYLTHQGSSFRSMMRTTFLSIMICSGALALATAIMTGFQKETMRVMQGVHAHIIVENNGDESSKQIAALSTIPEIKAVSPSYYAHGLIQNSEDALGSIVVIHGIDPQQEQKTTALNSYIQLPSGKNVPTLVHDNHVIIGQRLAENLHISLGDSLTLSYAPDQEFNSRSLRLDSFEVIVDGFIKTGIEEMDTSFVLCSYFLLLELWPELKPTSFNIKIKDEKNIAATLTSIREITKNTAYTWQDLYPSLMAALQLETIATFLVLALIILIASINLGALLFMIIMSKHADIALLRAMGASASAIIAIFFLVGSLLAFIASFIGIGIAYLLAIFLTYLMPIKLPDAYLVSHLPLNLNPLLFGGILLFVLLLSMVAVWISTRAIHTLPISTTLRFEK